MYFFKKEKKNLIICEKKREYKKTDVIWRIPAVKKQAKGS
jgi:hypothetical protein